MCDVFSCVHGGVSDAGSAIIYPCSDTRLGAKFQTVAMDFRKVFKMHDRLFVGLAGLGTDVQSLCVSCSCSLSEPAVRVRDEVTVCTARVAATFPFFSNRRYQLLRFRLKMYALREERDIAPETFGHLLAHMLYERRFAPHFVEPIVAGLNDKDEPYISGMDLVGAPVLTKDFVVAGTCTDNLFGMCESLYRPDMVRG